MLSILKRISFSIIAFAIVLLVFELGAKVVVHYVLGVQGNHYENYYREDPLLNLLTWTMKYDPHPFFGYENSRIRELEKAFAAPDRRNTFVIGVLGGSVAGGFGRYARKNPEKFYRLKEALPSIGDREIEIADLGIGGGRQPQQFIISAFFIDHLDMLINLDGFNEVYFRHFQPVYPLEFPGLSLKFYRRAEGGEIYSLIGQSARWAYQKMNHLAIRVPLASRSSLYFGVWTATHGNLYNLVRWSEEKYYDAAISTKQSAASWEMSEPELLSEQLGIWKKYSILQNELAKAVGTPVFFFLQPNQYLKNSKKLSEEEIGIAFDQTRAQDVNKRMQRLRNTLADMRATGLPAIDLTQVFLDVSDTVYRDMCCHLNARGNTIMAEAIVSAIIMERSQSSVAD